jgi:hypothetical protein
MQPLLPFRDVPPPLSVSRGGPWILNPDNRHYLLLPREQRKAEMDRRLSGTNRPKPTRWDQPPAQAPRRSPPRWGNRRSAPEPTLDNRRRQRTPSPVDRRPSRDNKKLLTLSLRPSSSSRNVCYGSRTGTEATGVLKQIVCTLAQVAVMHVRAILHHYCAGGSNFWLTNHIIPQGRPLAGSVSKN